LIAIVRIRVQIVRIGLWIIRIHVRIGIGWIRVWIVIIGVTVWMIGFPLIVIIEKRIVPPAPRATRIIIRSISATKNPTRRKPDLFLIMIRLCHANR
jgi:hypothetical protein